MLESTTAIGRSQAFKHLQSYICTAARYDVPTLLQGETGTGKEVAARAIHYNSARAANPFVPVNCGALPENLVENEFFGHQRGAFTDARSDTPGLIGIANGGTLFLDELEALSPRGQTVLLRFLDGQEVRPVGGKRYWKADVRIITATNVDLLELVAAGAMRQDMFYRVNVLTINVPPLRERGDDILHLADYFIARYCARYELGPRRLHPATAAWLVEHPWPGNVRELDNFIHRHILLSNSEEIKLEPGIHPEPGQAGTPCDCKDITSGIGFNEGKELAIRDFERRYLTELMAVSRGNVTRAAHRAGKERRALGKLLKKHGLNGARLS